MELSTSIPRELLQLLTADEAADYGLVPYRRDGGLLVCYGAANRDYSESVLELEVLSGLRVRVTPLAEEEFRQLLMRYYRADASASPPPGIRTADGFAGQGFLLALLSEALRDGAGAIHLEAYENNGRIRLRIDGKLVERYMLERRQYLTLVTRIKVLATLDLSERRMPQDGRIRYDRGGCRFDVRVSILPTIYGENVLLRLPTRRTDMLELSDLGFSPGQYDAYVRALSRPCGMILVCGPAGSGRRTTLYATLRRLNKTSANILTVEDPVEHLLEGVNQVQLKEQNGQTFAAVLDTLLRHDPDVIMLSELRDAAAARMAVRAAQTGRMLLSTLYAPTAWSAVARLTDMEVHPFQVADTLVMSVAQRLVRLLCPHCKREMPLSNGTGRLVADRNRGQSFGPVGCDACFHTGYSGRRAIYEVIPMDEGLADAVRRGRRNIGRMLRERGIGTLRDAAVELLSEGLTSEEEIKPLLG